MEKYLYRTFNPSGLAIASCVEWLNDNKDLKIISIMMEVGRIIVIYINPAWIKAERAAENM